MCQLLAFLFISIGLQELSIITGRNHKQNTPKHDSHDCTYRITEVECWTDRHHCRPQMGRTELKFITYIEHHTLRTSHLLYPSAIEKRLYLTTHKSVKLRNKLLVKGHCAAALDSTSSSMMLSVLKNNGYRRSGLLNLMLLERFSEH